MDVLARGLDWLMLAFRSNAAAAHTFALVCVAAGALVRLAVDHLVAGVVPFATFFPAVLIATLAGGIGPGITAWLVGGLSVWYLILNSAVGFTPPGVAELTSLGLYTATSALMVATAYVLRGLVGRLRTSEERLRLALEGGRLGAWDHDVHSDTVSWSARCREIYGFDSDGEPGYAGWLSHVHPDDRQRIDADFRRAADGRAGSYAAEFRYQRPSGEWRWVASFGRTIIDETGVADRVVGVTQDITARKQAEEALQAAKIEAERSSAAKTRFLAAASHDLRQPVQSLVLFLNILKERLGPDHPSSSVLMAAEQSVDGLCMLLDSLLDVSKLDAGLVVPRLAEVPLRPFLERLESEYAPRAVGAGIRLRVVGSGAVVHSDPVILERILRNLIENALRYTRRGGVLVGCRRGRDGVRICVVDTGIGIGLDELPHIFEEFYQVSNLERDRRKGLGLGLSVVDRLSRLLGHMVSVRSAVGRGSVFTIEVPRVRAPVAVLQEPAARPATRSHGLIVVVDDEALVRHSLEVMLEEWGHRVVAAGSAQEAIGKLSGLARSPDAILADYRLRNGETGVDAIRAIQARWGAHVPAALITGDTAPERLAEARQGGFRLLHKPVAYPELRKSLGSMLSRSVEPA